jgi:hypothetical protein
MWMCVVDVCFRYLLLHFISYECKLYIKIIVFLETYNIVVVEFLILGHFIAQKDILNQKGNRWNHLHVRVDSVTRSQPSLSPRAAGGPRRSASTTSHASYPSLRLPPPPHEVSTLLHHRPLHAIVLVSPPPLSIHRPTRLLRLLSTSTVGHPHCLVTTTAHTTITPPLPPTVNPPLCVPSPPPAPLQAVPLSVHLHLWSHPSPRGSGLICGVYMSCYMIENICVM